MASARELGGKDDFEEAARLGNVFGEGKIHFRPEGQNAPKSRDRVTRPSIVEHRRGSSPAAAPQGLVCLMMAAAAEAFWPRSATKSALRRIGQVVVTQLFPGELFGLKDAIA